MHTSYTFDRSAVANYFLVFENLASMQHFNQ